MYVPESPAANLDNTGATLLTERQRINDLDSKFYLVLITLRAKLSGAVYCNRSCLWVCVCFCVWVCYHDNSKLRASIFTKLGL